MALEHRDIDRRERAVYVQRSWRNGRIKYPKTDASIRSVPLQAVAIEALDRLAAGSGDDLVFPAVEGGYFDLHNFRNRYWKTAQAEAGIKPTRRVYDLRHTYATFALRAGVSMFDLSRFMGTSLSMIDLHHGHHARDCKPHSIQLLDAYCYRR